MFFAFQSCKYLKVSQAEQWQPEQLHISSIRFFKDREIFLHTHPDLKFADCVFITFKCQKREDKHDADDISLDRPDPCGTEDRQQSQAPLSYSIAAPSDHN